MKEHLFYKTTFCGPVGWYLIAGQTVLPNISQTDAFKCAFNFQYLK